MCRYVRLNTLNVMRVHGPCFNAPKSFATFINKLWLEPVDMLQFKTKTNVSQAEEAEFNKKIQTCNK